jgi:hypothetical protein
MNMIFQVSKRGTMASKTAVGIGKAVSALHDRDKATVYHVLHCLTQATDKADGSVTGRQGAASTRFRNGRNSSFSPRGWYRVICPYTIVQGQVQGERAFRCGYRWGLGT